MTAAEVAYPFRHWLCQEVVPGELVRAARISLPDVLSPHWIRYDNDSERRKWAMESRDGLPPEWLALLDALQGPSLLADVSAAVGADLRADPTCRGGGLHVTFGGGHLSPHLDYALHPCGLERRANLILFLDTADDWSFGGGLQLCDKFGKPVRYYYPEAGAALLWECGDDTVHAVEPLHRDAKPRLTAATYYLAEPRPGCTRRRAMYFPNRG